MINILFISHYLNVAGTETFMMNVLRYIDRKKYHIDFLIFSQNESQYSYEAQQLGAHIYRLPPRSSGLIYYKKLSSFFEEKSTFYRAVHFCGGSVSSIAPLYYAYKNSVPIRIVHSHNSSCEGVHNKLLHIFNRLFLKKYCTHFFACSTSAARFFFKNQKSIIIKNALVVDSYAFDEIRRNKFRLYNNISPDTKVIGHIGRFEQVKNHTFIVDIFESYNSLHSDSLLILVGDGNLKKNIEQKVKDLGLVDKVIFMGERKDIPDILGAMDCFLMPSFYEGLPFVLIEAQSSGLPCIISDTINKDVKIIPQLYFQSLRENSITWANKIKEVLEISVERKYAVSYLQEAGYDISSIIIFLEKVYCE